MFDVRVELLFLDGCPSHERLLPALRALVAEAGAELVLRRVGTTEAAQQARFLGSPTVRVNGRDVDPGADARTDYGLQCRLYRFAGLGPSPLPPEDWIRAALDAARAQ